MAGTPTAKLGIPLPAGGDDVAVPADLRAVAERIDQVVSWQDQGVRSARPAATSSLRGFRYLATDETVEYLCTGTGWIPLGLFVPRVTSLPLSPFDGQEVDFVADASDGVVWRLRYRSGSPSAQKWECIGGSPLRVAAAGPFPRVAAVDGTDILSLAVPLAGVYDVTAGGTHRVNGSSGSSVGAIQSAYLDLKQGGSLVANGGFAFLSDSTVVTANSDVRAYGSMHRKGRLTLAAVALKLNNEDTSYGFQENVYLELMPVRL